MSVRRAPCSLRDATLIILGLPCVPRALPCSATLCCGLVRYTLLSLSPASPPWPKCGNTAVYCVFKLFWPCKNRFLKSDKEGQLRRRSPIFSEFLTIHPGQPPPADSVSPTAVGPTRINLY